MRNKELYAWAAGFFDGEGTISIVGHGVSLRVPQKIKLPLDRLQQLYGGAIYHSNKITASGRPTELYLWQINGKDAIATLKTIKPFLVNKLSLTIEAIETYKRLYQRENYQTPEQKARRIEIKRLRSSGMKFKDIGNQFNITKQRAHKIFHTATV